MIRVVSIPKLIVSLSFFVFVIPLKGFAQSEFLEKPLIEEYELEPGFSYGVYSFLVKTAQVRSDVTYIKLDLDKSYLFAVKAKDIGKTRTDVQTIALRSNAIVAINANFFDTNGSALGLVINNFSILNKMHTGGRVLTGVFYVKHGKPGIIHRDQFDADGIELAVQAGPRLIIDGKAVDVNAPDESNRRSGVAITRSGKIVIFATQTRFPGATFHQIQEMLLNSAFDAIDALNFDGGSSSQLFIKEHKNLPQKIFITGGNAVPVALVVKK